ncbi:OmpH family outer membrane protein [Sulfurihydrogenibium azorense]|uniref:OmpH family outer membrane protein n=1 Tax=Sulfurihydrogenibium azorense TaxID=309806 RepID=UPI00240A9223|nr:OmpH family outer membrane protein [Sulfurihydrogenibium azorense]MDM7273819.1 OmpH family outer membrane protein [Sulfurihydrogenibium azorense]
MKKFVAVLSVFLLMALSMIVKAADIVFIDVQAVVNNSKAGKDAQALLEEAGKKAQAEVEAKQKTLKQDQKSQEEFQAFAIQKQQEVLKRRDELLGQFMKLVQDNLESFAKEKNYSLIVDKQAVLYGKPELDKTQEFLNYFDSKYEKGPKIK